MTLPQVVEDREYGKFREGSSAGETRVAVVIEGGGGGGGSVNSAGSFESQAVGTSAATFSKPANAVGFILLSESPNTDNVRWCVGAVATALIGSLYEPGRDSGYVPLSADISVIAIGGTQKVSVQWILSS
jgi:hypothetical protein